jgi:hypothetical protein
MMVVAAGMLLGRTSNAAAEEIPSELAPYFTPPAEFAGKVTPGPQLVNLSSGKTPQTKEEWATRRKEILNAWQALMGEWPPLLEHPKLEILETSRREDFTQHRIRLEIAPGQTGEGYLLIPDGKGPFPAVYVPFYDPETSIGLGKKPLRDFAYQLTKRGFVSLSMGAPGGDARKPVLSTAAKCQPLSYLGYLSANAWQALADRPEVDRKRIGVMGHSYGGKWAMFGSCLWEKFACAVWSDPGIVFDEARISINYWEPWYLGYEPGYTRKPGLITAQSPRTGPYKTMMEQGRSLSEFQMLMAPRPFLVSGGSEDFPSRWTDLNRVREAYTVQKVPALAGMHNRPLHEPTEESNALAYRFMVWALKERPIQ